MEILLNAKQTMIVDDADVSLIRNSGFKWRAFNNRGKWCMRGVIKHYVGIVITRAGKRRSKFKQEYLFLHKLLIPGSSRIDHKDGDGLNNQRDNLRVCTNSQNMMNMRKRNGTTSNFKGVHWRIEKHKWQAIIHIPGKVKHLGYFADELLAAQAYDDVARVEFGEF